MATAARRLLPALRNSLSGSGGAARGVSTERAVGPAAAAVLGSHTAKWMQDTSKKSPMELINAVPPIKVEGRIAACDGRKDKGHETASLGHPIEYICLDLDQPAVCKYCGLRFVQDHHH
ncbi:NADH dehydrogenase [ubiquinone] iron-sulfur protein 6, mitochondrial [Oryza brachyantha]|uniref:NADH dehydrogenase [ubiquinone] iron-sulfur protein 6, mitochondrial n=1 Tax=Oryza brachyantha TaxID=4533 RepID=J3MQL5_ORYBR|nr:NADH dehydrogenase [ubiquinone] iron-sulfur protein 6, mitochondrial [Oryza brachyantha]